jgi:hypothetical protein
MLVSPASFTMFHQHRGEPGVHPKHWASGRQNQGMTAEPQGIWQLELLGDFHGFPGADGRLYETFTYWKKKVVDLKNTWKSQSQQSTELLSFWSQMSSDFHCESAILGRMEMWRHFLAPYHHPRIARKCPNMSQYVPCWEHLLINLHRHLRSVSEKMGTSIWVDLLRRSAFRHGISGICNHQEDVSRAWKDEENCDNHQISGTGNPKMLLNPKKRSSKCFENTVKHVQVTRSR